MRSGMGIAAVMAALAAGGASAADHAFDKTAPLSDGRVVLDGEAGPIRFSEVVVKAIPDEAKIAKARPYDRSRPRPTVVVSNTGDGEAGIRYQLTLEDDDGNVYMKCIRSSDIDEQAKDDTVNVCALEEMKTVDWPKVTRVHLVAKIEVEED